MLTTGSLLNVKLKVLPSQRGKVGFTVVGGSQGSYLAESRNHIRFLPALCSEKPRDTNPGYMKFLEYLVFVRYVIVLVLPRISIQNCPFASALINTSP